MDGFDETKICWSGLAPDGGLRMVFASWVCSRQTRGGVSFDVFRLPGGTHFYAPPLDAWRTWRSEAVTRWRDDVGA
jgi:hypothetical protein